MENNFEPNPAKDKDSYYGVAGFLWEVVKIFILALVIIAPIRAFLFQPFFVQGASMEPNFENGEYLIVNELGYKETELKIGNLDLADIEPYKELERGDVIVFRYPKDPRSFFIKRVIGLPGETIEVKNGEISIYDSNGKFKLRLNEKEYLSSDVETRGDVHLELKEDEYFVLGDNREFSHDSRSWGPVSKDKIIGKVLIRAWPFNRVKIF